MGTLIDYDGPVTLEIGEGPTGFDLREDGSMMRLRRGIQGGEHLDVAFRVHGVSANALELSVTATRVSDGAATAATLFRELNDRRVQFEDDHFIRFGDQLRSLPEFGPDILDGEQLRISATITPGSGAPVMASVVVTVVADP